LEKLKTAGINQHDISLKVGADQSSISRMQRQLFKSSKWQTVERIQSLYTHICLNNKSVDDFPDYEEYIESQENEAV